MLKYLSYINVHFSMPEVISHINIYDNLPNNRLSTEKRSNQYQMSLATHMIIFHVS